MNKNRTILIADDEPYLLEILEYNLSKEGFTIITARNGNEAIEKAELYNPDLMILDILMPYKSGMEVCRLLRLQPRFSDTFIIFLTALSDEAIHIKGFENGADDYINKPVNTKILISRVNALLRRKKNKSKDAKILTKIHNEKNNKKE